VADRTLRASDSGASGALKSRVLVLHQSRSQSRHRRQGQVADGGKLGGRGRKNLSSAATKVTKARDSAYWAGRIKAKAAAGDETAMAVEAAVGEKSTGRG
jgi:hypothetical protein